MRELVIDYLLEGQRRGYTIISPTDGIPPENVKAIWREAMPRGQAWNEYIGARSLKCWVLPGGEAALCEVRVTRRADEAGRTGIRQAHVHVGTAAEIHAVLLNRLAALPAAVVSDAERKLASKEWQLLFRKHREAHAPRRMLKPQTILSRPYSAEGWSFVEACILLLATRATLLTNLIEVSPRINPFADRLLSFTTLALDVRDETRLVGVPLRHAEAASVPFIDIR
jgi:hypothetical protein